MPPVRLLAVEAGDEFRLAKDVTVHCVDDRHSCLRGVLRCAGRDVELRIQCL